MSDIALVPHTEVSRPLSALEYFHACVGAHPDSLLPAREVIVTVEGTGRLDPAGLARALAAVAAVNPGCRLRIAGERHRSRFESDGVATPLRVVDGCDWDGMSETGADFLRATPLGPATGPLSELILIEARGTGRTRLVLRAHHAAMDGQGVMHVFHELFRALRGEALQGSNAPFSDTELMLHHGVKWSSSRWMRPAPLTGAPAGDDPRNLWRRISIKGRRSNSMLKLVAAFAEFAHRHGERRPALFAVPINGRRHLDGMRTTQNFTNMLLVPLHPGEPVERFKERLNAMLDAKMETAYFRFVEHAKRLPPKWVDGLSGRNRRNYRRRTLHETCLISHLGYSKCAQLSCAGFAAEQVWGVPLQGNAFCAVFATEKYLEVSLGLPAVFAGEGRLDALVEHLERCLDAKAV